MTSNLFCISRLLAFTLLSLRLTGISAAYAPSLSDNGQLQERDGILSNISPGDLPALLAADVLAEKFDMVEAMLDEDCPDQGLNETALPTNLLNETALSSSMLNESSLTTTLLNETNMADSLLNETGLTDALLNKTGFAMLQNILHSREVYNPTIMHPDSRTVWYSGSRVTVKWSVHDAPKKITNRKGKIILGYIEDDGMNEHLDLDRPLAEDFDILDGHVDIQVPDVDPRDNYVVILQGDSGNRSPLFSIL